MSRLKKAWKYGTKKKVKYEKWQEKREEKQIESLKRRKKIQEFKTGIYKAKAQRHAGRGTRTRIGERASAFSSSMEQSIFGMPPRQAPKRKPKKKGKRIVIYT